MSAIETTSLAPERLEIIRGILKDRRVVRVHELSSELGVSAATVRRDLTALDRAGHVRKVHGGAIGIDSLLEEPLFDDKASLAAREKQAIARYALAEIQPNDSVYLDGGSTVLALAHLLVNRSALTVVTNSLRVAGALSGTGPRVLLVGGELRRLSQTFVGPLTEPLIECLHFDKAFMGTMGLSLENGLTTTDPAEAFTKKLVTKHAEQVFLLSDSSKIGKVTFAHAGNVAQINTLITDSGISPSLKQKLKKCNVNVVVARVTK